VLPYTFYSIVSAHPTLLCAILVGEAIEMLNSIFKLKYNVSHLCVVLFLRSHSPEHICRESPWKGFKNSSGRDFELVFLQSPYPTRVANGRRVG